ncbi:hypothetical protein [Methylibium petroleiphilum]
MNDTLEFPEIVDAPSARTDVAVAAAGAIDLTKIDLTDVALAQFGKWRPAAAKLKADNEKLVLDLSTQAKIDEAVSLRQRTINQPKAAANKVATALKSKFAQTSKSVGAEVEALHKAYDEAGEPLTAQITAAQKKLDDEKEARRKAEEERLQGLRASVDQIMVKWLDRCKVDGITSERITAGIGMFANLAMPAEVADVKAYWVTAYADTAASMIALRDAAKRSEDAAALEAQRMENERVAAENARVAADLQRQAEEIEAARQRAIAPAAQPVTVGMAENPEPGKPEAAPITAAQLPTESALNEQEAPSLGEPQGSSAGSDRGVDSRKSQAGSPVETRQPITQDAQESGSLPGTPGACASTGAEAAEAPGSGDEGKAAHADECTADTRPAINVGEINRRLGFTVTSTFVKDTLGITPEGFSKGGTAIWSARAWPLICAALVAHVQEKAGE